MKSWISLSLSLYIYIYIERERERERETWKDVYAAFLIKKTSRRMLCIE